MKKAFKIVGLSAIALALFIAVLLFSLYHLIQVGEFRQFLISEIERRTHLKVRVGEAELQMGRVVGISFRDIALIEPDKDRPVITAEKALIRVALLPLLERKMVFNEIRFYRPTLRVERDEQGKIPLPGWMAQLPFRKQAEDQFTLDLREIKIEKGEVLFADPQPEANRASAYLRDLELTIRRIRASDLARSAAEASLKSTAHEEGRLAVEFGLKTAMEQQGDGSRVQLISKGKILFPEAGLDLGQAWLEAETRMEGLPASLVREYFARLLPVRGVRGILAPTLRWQGSPAQRLRVQGQIDFKELEVDAPDIFAGPVSPGSGRLQLEMEWTPQEIRFPRLEIHSTEINLSAQGSMRSLGEKEPFLEVNLTTPFLPLVRVRKYVPLKVLHSPQWEVLVKGMNQGEVKLTKAGVGGPLSGIRRMFEPGFENTLWLDAEVKGMGGNLPGDHPLPLRGISGRIVLEKGVLYYRNFKGMVGLSRLAEIEGSQKGILAGRKYLELRVKGEADLRQLRDQLKAGFIPDQAAKAVAVLQELSGKGRFGLLLRTDFASSHHYEGRLSLENARLRIDDFSLSQVKGELSFSPQEIRAEKVNALLGGSPVLIRVALRNLSEKPVFDLSVDSSGVKAGEALRLLLSLGSPQDAGTIRGSLRYQGFLAHSGERNLTGSLELIGVQIPLKIFRQPFREVRGKVILDGKGFDFQGVKGQVAGYRIDLAGRWRYLEKPQLTFTLNSPELDIATLLPQEEPRGNDWQDRLQVRGRMNIDKGRYEGFEFTDLKSDLTLDKRVWRLENFSAKSQGGTVQGAGAFIDAADGLRFSLEPKVQGVPVEGFLKWFDTGTREITGKVNLAGKFESQGATGAERKRNLSGNFQLEIKDGMARRLQLLVRILNVMDLTRWFSFQLPDLKQKGIRFRSITGDFKVKNGIYSTENLIVDSDDISITGAGQVDGPNDAIDAVLAFRPFPRVGSVVSYIPLIGPGIAGIKDSIMVASFRVQGPVDDATITPAPLSTLSEFFFSALKIPLKMIPLPSGEKK